MVTPIFFFHVSLDLEWHRVSALEARFCNIWHIITQLWLPFYVLLYFMSEQTFFQSLLIQLFFLWIMSEFDTYPHAVVANLRLFCRSHDPTQNCDKILNTENFTTNFSICIQNPYCCQSQLQQRRKIAS